LLFRTLFSTKQSLSIVLEITKKHVVSNQSNFLLDKELLIAHNRRKAVGVRITAEGFSKRRQLWRPGRNRRGKSPRHENLGRVDANFSFAFPNE
jgi:hypothetical protein